MYDFKLKQQIFTAVGRLALSGLTQITPAFISQIDRENKIIALTPKVFGNDARCDQLSVLDTEGHLISGEPAFEGHELHVAIYQNVQNVGAIVQFGAKHTLSWAVSRREMPVHGAFRQQLGKCIPCISEFCENWDYELLQDGKGALIDEQCALSFAQSATRAVERAVHMEHCAEISILAENIQHWFKNLYSQNETLL